MTEQVRRSRTRPRQRTRPTLGPGAFEQPLDVVGPLTIASSDGPPKPLFTSFPRRPMPTPLTTLSPGAAAFPVIPRQQAQRHPAPSPARSSHGQLAPGPRLARSPVPAAHDVLYSSASPAAVPPPLLQAGPFRNGSEAVGGVRRRVPSSSSVPAAQAPPPAPERLARPPPPHPSTLGYQHAAPVVYPTGPPSPFAPSAFVNPAVPTRYGGPAYGPSGTWHPAQQQQHHQPHVSHGWQHSPAGWQWDPHAQAYGFYYHFYPPPPVASPPAFSPPPKVPAVVIQPPPAPSLNDDAPAPPADDAAPANDAAPVHQVWLELLSPLGGGPTDIEIRRAAKLQKDWVAALEANSGTKQYELAPPAKATGEDRVGSGAVLHGDQWALTPGEDGAPAADEEPERDEDDEPLELDIYVRPYRLAAGRAHR